jgi:pilus assembly protein CpaD
MVRPIRKTALLASIAAFAVLAGCARPPVVTTGSVEPPADYRDRHPIVITTSPKSISIYPFRGPGGLDKRQRQDIREFAEDYRRAGRSHITAMMPSGGGKLQKQTIGFIRKELAAAGIPAAYLRTGHYEPLNPSDAAPVKLEFDAVSAKVASDCSKWNRDIIDGGTSRGFENRQYDNFGCSYQSALAAQVADPTDLARPRVAGPVQVGKRIDDITTLGAGEDPSTDWKIQVTDGTE